MDFSFFCIVAVTLAVMNVCVCVLFETGMLLTVVPGVHDGLFVVSHCRDNAVKFVRCPIFA